MYVINTASGHARKVPEPLHQPHGVAVTPDGKHAYVTDTAKAYVSNANENTVSAIDTARGRVVKTIGLGSGSGGQLNHIPTGIALSPEGHI